ncbi:protein-disulfide oxidoreductase DsbI [Helicobacter sp. 11S02596-1]|uniref:protein-disulfide oxidoreductase DsbI n=1 Tax=Helicobacter sp. 11S02596-1 TaxID=1476194 RepID=UPI000BA7D40F|nr:protein-disulfide oxidoreductase DsbI [Helicobacter sp. 11S02596-1]PAF44529.1 disulfide oxidoreductase [Helicobacter sp. 11S02596-1]
MIKKLWKEFISSPILTIAKWQDRRFLWILMAIVTIGLVLIAHYLFQDYLYMLPCEQCVYIRYAFFVMALGGIIAAFKPQNLILKLIGYVLAFYGGIAGVMYSLKLNKIHHAAHSTDPMAMFGVQGCSAEPSFPFGLPLDKWFPDWFLPTGDCGFDNPMVPDGVVLEGVRKAMVDFYSDGWYLIPSEHFMNMAQACLLGYAVCLIILAVMAGSHIYRFFRKSSI